MIFEFSFLKNSEEDFMSLWNRKFIQLKIFVLSKN